MSLNIPESEKPRVVIVGAGFAGLKFARTLSTNKYQIVLIDRNNYHQFQPLFYQVATAGLEPSAISFPLRKIFQRISGLHIRLCDVIEIKSNESTIITSAGELHYNYLVLATGAVTNFFGMKKLAETAFPMKTVGEALELRNNILRNYEAALISDIDGEAEKLMNIVIVGGGPTGVELAGAIAEMRNYVLPKDYPDLDFGEMKIYLVEASGRILGSMSESAGRKATHFLESLGVKILTDIQVTGYENDKVLLHNGETLLARTLIWAAGIRGELPSGVSNASVKKGNRLLVDRYSKVDGNSNIFAIGDIAYMSTEWYPDGHPQVAQVALQQASTLAHNLNRSENAQKWRKFRYIDKGSMATIGRNKAVVDLPFFRFQGFFAWLVWMFVHLMSIVGVKNRLLIFINWLWNYLTYDQSLRLIIQPGKKNTNQLS